MNRELDELVRDLSGAGQWLAQQVPKVVDKSAERVRDEARRLAPRTGLPHYAAAITAEVRRQGYEVVGEIGPELGGQGSLGHILEYGTSRTPPHAHMGPALDREAPRYEEALADLLDPLR